jgi:CRP-like cAMP-binding protein
MWIVSLATNHRASVAERRYRAPALQAEQCDMSQSQNLILASLSQNIFDAMEPRLKRVTLNFGDMIAEPGEPVRRVYFPFSGVVSLVIDMADGPMIETAMVGRDGVANATSALDGKVAMYRGLIQIAGEAVTIDPDALRSLAREFEPLQSILIRHEQLLLAQAQQSAGCNASHKVEERMCRWLLRMRDLTGSEDLQLTQEFLAQMLGVRRTSVSVVANTLQKAGFIRYRRGNIRLLDIEQLKEGACECYETVKGHYDRMLA